MNPFIDQDIAQAVNGTDRIKAKLTYLKILISNEMSNPRAKSGAEVFFKNSFITSS